MITKNTKIILQTGLILTLIVPLAAMNNDFSANAQMPPRSKEAIFSSIEERLSGFGGLFLDDNGRLNVYVTDPSKTTTVDESIFSDKLESHHLEKGIVILQGKQSWHQWAEWQQTAAQLFENRDLGITMIAMDDKNQSLYIGFAQYNAASVMEVHEFLKINNIPSDMVRFQVTGEVIPVSHGVTINPLKGGAQINPVGDIWNCTVGFIADKESNGQRVAITASHCEVGTKDLAGDQQFRQPNGGSVIGTEVVNSNKPPPRYSDTLLFAPSISSNKGQIFVDGVTNTVVSETLSQMQGDPVCGYGSTSHNRCGTIQLTGIQMNDPGIGGTLYGQVKVNFGVAEGDSGGPAYKNVAGGVSAMGIFWGGAGSSISFYSPLSGIEFDLGLLDLT